MLLLIGAFIAGMLTVLAPCVLPLLPIIIGGSVNTKEIDKKRPLIISVSLAFSLLLFTLLLKFTTLLIDIPPKSITIFSGTIIVLLGLFTLFPMVYARLLGKLGIESKALSLLGKGQNSKNKYIGAVITGAALGPVFSSCSPVYGYILATVLPVSLGLALSYMISYILGLALVLLLIGYYGQKFVKRIKWLANPTGFFQRIMAVLFIAVGLLIITGQDKALQTWVSRNTPFNIDSLSEKLLPSDNRKTNDGELFNVNPYPASEIVGVDQWINSGPQSIKELRGKVVLVDFWTYSCINCIRNNPYIENWYRSYKDKGFTVLGLHAPEFSFERNKANVEKAVIDQGLSYPVGLDNDFASWGAFGNRFWPTYYLIDADGNVRRIHSGEGEYEQSEQAIRQLLQENGATLESKMFTKSSSVPISDKQTPETYLGIKRASNFTGNPKALGSSDIAPFTFPTSKPLGTDYWALSGSWTVTGEHITALVDAKLRFNVAAKDVYVVASADKEKNMRLFVDGIEIEKTNFAGSDVSDGKVKVSSSRLYKLVDFGSFKDGAVIELEVDPGVQLNVFTFGS